MYEYVEYPIYLIPYFLKCRILIVLEERIKVSECGVMIITCFFFWLIFKKIFIHERSKDVLVIVCFCSPFDVFMGFCFSRPAWPFCTQAQMS